MKKVRWIVSGYWTEFPGLTQQCRDSFPSMNDITRARTADTVLFDFVIKRASRNSKGNGGGLDSATVFNQSKFDVLSFYLLEGFSA